MATATVPRYFAGFRGIVSSRVGQSIRRHLHGDALSDPADFPHADLEGQWKRSRAGGRRRRGDTEHRPRFFRLAVGQAAKEKVHRASGLPVGRVAKPLMGVATVWQSVLAGRFLDRSALAPLCPARRAYRLFSGRGE